MIEKFRTYLEYQDRKSLPYFENTYGETDDEREIESLCLEISEHFSGLVFDYRKNTKILEIVKDDFANLVEIMYRIGNDVKAEILEGLFRSLYESTGIAWSYLDKVILTGKKGFAALTDKHSTMYEMPFDASEPLFYLHVDEGILSIADNAECVFEMRVIDAAEKAMKHQMGMCQLYHNKKLRGEELYPNSNVYTKMIGGRYMTVRENKVDELNQELKSKMGKGILPAGFEIIKEKDDKSTYTVKYDYEDYRLIKMLHSNFVIKEEL